MNNGQANHGHGGEHCQDPKNTLNSDDHGVDTHKMLKLLWFSQRQIAWHSRREGRSTCCAILNATIVVEHRPDFTSTCVTSNLTPAGLSSTVFNIYANMHAFLHSFFVFAKFNRWYMHDSQDITVCLLLFYNFKKSILMPCFSWFCFSRSCYSTFSQSSSVKSCFFLQGPVSIDNAEHHSSWNVSLTLWCCLILPGWMLPFLDNCYQDTNFFPLHLWLFVLHNWTLYPDRLISCLHCVAETIIRHGRHPCVDVVPVDRWHPYTVVELETTRVFQLPGFTSLSGIERLFSGFQRALLVPQTWHALSDALPSFCLDENKRRNLHLSSDPYRQYAGGTAPLIRAPCLNLLATPCCKWWDPNQKQLHNHRKQRIKRHLFLERELSSAERIHKQVNTWVFLSCSVVHSFQKYQASPSIIRLIWVISILQSPSGVATFRILLRVVHVQCLMHTGVFTNNCWRS